MRIIPKKIKVKNTVWKCYSMADVIVALIVFAIIFIAITSGAFAFAVIMGLLAVVMFMPTQDGIFYSCILENIKFLFAKKVYTENADKQKERVDALLNLKDIKENGLIEYSGGYFGRVIKVGQKNFGIEDVVQQNIDIDYLANALKMLDGTQCADIIKIDRPVNLDNFAQDLFGRLAEMKESVDGEEVREIKTAILRERIDRIDKMNNIRKQYLSDYYIVVYGRNELDLENTTINVASEINKCGLNTKLLGRKETAIFLKYSFSRNFDEREIKEIDDNRLIAWVKPKKVEFKANSYTVDETQAAVFAIADYPLRVRNAWGADVFNIPNTKVVLHVKPVDKFKAIKRIDKCIGEMETKQILSEKASEANSAETHRETMNALLEHGNYMNEESLAMLAESDTVWVPTLVTVRNLLGDGRYDDETLKPIIESAEENIRKAFRLGIKTAPGSDAGAYRVLHGKGIRDEVQSFVEILGDQDAAYRWLAEGEAEIKKKFTVTVHW